jgi:hypothetical protein
MVALPSNCAAGRAKRATDRPHERGALHPSAGPGGVEASRAPTDPRRGRSEQIVGRPGSSADRVGVPGRPSAYPRASPHRDSGSATRSRSSKHGAQGASRRGQACVGDLGDPGRERDAREPAETGPGIGDQIVLPNYAARAGDRATGQSRPVARTASAAL